jgi:hypothetical protein
MWGSMPTREFSYNNSLLILRWPLTLSQIKVELDSKLLGVIKDQRALREGVHFTVEDGNQLTIKRAPSWGLVDIGAYDNDVPLQAKDPKPRVDPSKLAYFLGALHVLIMLLIPFSKALQEKGLSFWVVAFFAFLFFLHGYLISRRALFALLSLLFLYATDIVAAGLDIVIGERPFTGIFLRILFLRWMYNAIPEKAKTKGLISLALSLLSGFGLWSYLNTPPEPSAQLRQYTEEVVVVIQKDPNDCGVATLQAMLAGYGISTNYELLRTRLKTDETGTNIDEMEEAAPEYGLLVAQIVEHPDTLFSPEANLLPAIVILTNGESNHMLLLWEFEGDKIEALDPAKGRVFLTAEEIKEHLLIYSQATPTTIYREWACGKDYLRRIQDWAHRLELSDEQAVTLQQQACKTTDWNPIAVLDAKLRRSVANPTLIKKAELLSVLGDPSSTPELDEYRYALPAPTNKDGTTQVYLRGAVILTALGKK